MKVLLLTPPMTQLNTPYPATAYLTGFLRKNGFDAVQADPAIELVLKLFSTEGLSEMRAEIQAGLKSQKGAKAGLLPASIGFFLDHSDQYIQMVEPVVRFLQGKDPSLALRIVSREFLPEGPRFVAVNEGADPDGSDPISWAFGSLGVQDRAKYLASLFIDDLADLVREGIDSRFELSRYGEKLAASSPTFEPLDEALRSNPTLVDRYLQQIVENLIQQFSPTVIGLTVPFPGNVYGAFRIAQQIKKISPKSILIMGGGFVNTELRDLSEPRVFD